MDLAASGFLQPAGAATASAASHSSEEPPAHAHRHSQHRHKVTVSAAAFGHSSDELQATHHHRQRPGRQQQPSTSAESLPVFNEYPPVFSSKPNQPLQRQQQQEHALLQQPQHLPRASAHGPTDTDAAEPDDYSPGAKHLLQITGLISEDQEPMQEADEELILTQPDENAMVSDQDHVMLQQPSPPPAHRHRPTQDLAKTTAPLQLQRLNAHHGPAVRGNLLVKTLGVQTPAALHAPGCSVQHRHSLRQSGELQLQAPPSAQHAEAEHGRAGPKNATAHQASIVQHTESEHGRGQVQRDVVEQLDRDSICRIADGVQQPAKRSKSCPPDSFHAGHGMPADRHGTGGAQPIDDMTTHSDSDTVADDAVMADAAVSVQQQDLPQQPEAMQAMQFSGVAPPLQQSQQQVLQYQPLQRQHQQQQPFAQAHESMPSPQPAAISPNPTAANLPGQETAASPKSPPGGMAPDQNGTLDITQPNLTMPPSRADHHALLSTAKTSGSFPIPGPSASTLVASKRAAMAHADALLAQDGTAQVPCNSAHPSEQPAAGATVAAGAKGTRAAPTGPPAAPVARPQPARAHSGKWKQRAGQRDAAFGEGSIEPYLVTSAALQAQGGIAQQTAGQMDLLDHAAQPQSVAGAGYKYQEVVRKKAEREKLQVSLSFRPKPTGSAPIIVSCCYR